MYSYLENNHLDMTIVQSSDLSKAKRVLVCYVGFAVINGAPLAAQTFNESVEHVEECFETNDSQGAELVIDEAVIEQLKIEKTERQSRKFQQLN
jgi:hypothetical protein